MFDVILSVIAAFRVSSAAKYGICYFYPHRETIQIFMQSDDEDTTLHSCFDSLKTAVMGCCYSICHKDTDPQVNITSLFTCKAL